ncbi:MAG: hypothetical protein ACXWC9_09650 [Pseudobdellovibrionaceae bacterium]
MKCLRRIILLFSAVFTLSGNAQVYDLAHWDQVWTKFKNLEAIQNPESAQAKKVAADLADSIARHFDANGVRYTRSGQTALLIKVLPDNKIAGAHPLNRFAKSVSEKMNGVRFVVDPLKLKKEAASAIYYESNRKLYMDFESILNLKTSHYMGHELIHAKFHRMELAGQDHIYLGWIRPSEGYQFVEVGYEDGFHLDEIPAYYFQSLLLLKELKRASGPQRTELKKLLKRVLKQGQELSGHFEIGDLVKGAPAALSEKRDMKFDELDAHHIVEIASGPYLIVFQLQKANFPSQEALFAELKQRLSRLERNYVSARIAFDGALTALAAGDLKAAEKSLSENKDIVLGDHP